jgi:hypothetical protein
MWTVEASSITSVPSFALTWMRFLGLGLGDPVPHANTIWTYREALTRAGAVEPLFALFDQALREAERETLTSI